MKKCFALLGATMLSLTAIAQDWNLTGPEAPYHLGTTGGPSDMALAPDHTPYVTFTQLPNMYKVKALKFNGTAWVAVGGDISANNSYKPSIAIDGNGVPFVVYADGGAMGKATVKKFDGANWVTVGQAGFSTGAVDEPQMEISDDGILYVAYRDDATGGKATVMKFNGSSWVAVGTPGFSSSAITSPGLAFHPDGTPYLGYLESSGKGTVAKYNGTQWVAVGSPQFTPGTSTGLFAFSSFDIDDQGNPYFAYTDMQNSEKAVVMKFTGTEWIFIGANGFSDTDARFIKIVVYNQTPYVAYIRNYTSNSHVVVQRYIGTEWVKIGANDAQGSNWPNLVIYPDGANGMIHYLSMGYGTLTSPMVYVAKLALCASVPDNTTPASNLSVCTGNATTLSVSGDGSLITWYNEAGTVLGTGNEYTTDPLASTTTFFAGTSMQCGLAIQVTVSSPTITITGKTSICSGESTTLTAAGAATYTWQNGPNTAAYTVAPGESTTYTVTGKDASNCSSTKSQLVTVSSNPTVTITGTTTICNGEATTLTAVGAVTYTWQNGPNTAAYAVSPEQSTIYTVTGKNTNDCSSTVSKEVTVNTVDNDVSVDGITLVAEADHATYQWINCDLNALIIGATGRTFTPELSGTYAVMVSQNLCVRTSDCHEVLITDTADEEEQVLSLYPNPSRGSITAKGAYASKFQVTNSLGEVILEFELNEDNGFSRELDNLSSGIYYVRFASAGNNISTQKIVIGD